MLKTYRSLGLLLSTLLFCVAASASADTYPDKPITIIVPFAAGGAGDQLARSLGNQLTASWRQAVVIDNKPGANGTLATQAAIRAKPDGYTLLLHNTTLIQSPSLMSNVGYDPFKQLESVAHIGTQPIAIAVSAKSPIKSIDQLSRAIRQGDVKSYGSFGSGSTGHIYGELFRSIHESDIVHVPYKGESPMLPDLMSDRVPFGWISGATAHTTQKDNTLRILAITGPVRLEGLKDTPTLSEVGIKGFEVVGWWGLFAPAGTPQDVLKKISAQVQLTLKKEDFIATLNQQAIAPSRMEPGSFATSMKRDSQWWSSVITKYDIKSQ
jgi:tripartite-type tricarboxylate transporter receptor subunit TctC